MGGFRRYSWPVTFSVVALGCLLVAGGLWELNSLLRQPHLTTAIRRQDRVPSLGGVFTHVMRSRTGRVGVLVAWAWVGLHFFAK